MRIVEILDDIRRPYINQLSEVAGKHEYHIEPALRRSDGSVARDGMLDTPCRYDFVHKDTGTTHSIDATQRVEFAPIHIELDGKVLDISMFCWDWLTLDIAGLSEDISGPQMRNWFMRWFDENDANPRNAENLYGVVHFITDAEIVGEDVRFHIDLGSVSAAAVVELIEELLDRGATGLKLWA